MVTVISKDEIGASQGKEVVLGSEHRPESTQIDTHRPLVQRVEKRLQPKAAIRKFKSSNA